MSERTAGKSSTTDLCKQWLAGTINLGQLHEGICQQLGVCAPAPATPIPMHIFCAKCGAQHIDEGDFATKVHHTHACQHCGHVWRPAVVPTVGVRFLPGFKNGE